jgi:hypothetical protein
MWNEVFLLILTLVICNIGMYVRLVIFGNHNWEEYKNFAVIANIGVIIFFLLLSRGIIKL